MALQALNGLRKTLRPNSGPCNVVLCPFRMFSLGQRVQPATMIEFKEIEYFDHTASHAADTFRTAAVMMREPERQKEQEKRKATSRLSPWS